MDVVENKLNDTLSKVRPSDDFVNPILRLGRVGTNFKKIVSNKAIESLRVQHREINRDKEKRQGRYNAVVSQLKSNISTTISSARKIDLEEVFEFEEEVSDFVNEWEDELENFSEIFHSQINEYSDELSTIERLLKLRDVCIQLQKQ